MPFTASYARALIQKAKEEALIKQGQRIKMICEDIEVLIAINASNQRNRYRFVFDTSEIGSIEEAVIAHLLAHEFVVSREGVQTILISWDTP